MIFAVLAMVAERPPVAGCNISHHPAHRQRPSVPPGGRRGDLGGCLGGMKANTAFRAGEDSPSRKPGQDITASPGVTWSCDRAQSADSRSEERGTECWAAFRSAGNMKQDMELL